MKAEAFESVFKEVLRAAIFKQKIKIAYIMDEESKVSRVTYYRLLKELCERDILRKEGKVYYVKDWFRNIVLGIVTRNNIVEYGIDKYVRW
jgi:hypothetical protein